MSNQGNWHYPHNGVVKRIDQSPPRSKDDKNLLSIERLRKIDYEIYFIQDIYIDDMHDKQITRLEEIDGLFKIGNDPHDDKTLSSYLSTDMVLTKKIAEDYGIKPHGGQDKEVNQSMLTTNLQD